MTPPFRFRRTLSFASVIVAGLILVLLGIRETSAQSIAEHPEWPGKGQLLRTKGVPNWMLP